MMFHEHGVVTTHWNKIKILKQIRGPGRFHVENGPTEASKWWTLPTLPTASQHKLQNLRAAAVRTQSHNCLQFPQPSIVFNAHPLCLKHNTLAALPCNEEAKAAKAFCETSHEVGGTEQCRFGCRFNYKAIRQCVSKCWWISFSYIVAKSFRGSIGALCSSLIPMSAMQACSPYFPWPKLICAKEKKLSLRRRCD